MFEYACAQLSTLEADAGFPIEGGTPTSALRDVPLAGNFITFSLCLSVVRIGAPPLQPAALPFVPYGFVLVRVLRSSRRKVIGVGTH